MPIYTDPHPDPSPMFECMDCGRRVEEDELEGRLCTCGGYLQNISVPRQE